MNFNFDLTGLQVVVNFLFTTTLNLTGHRNDVFTAEGVRHGQCVRIEVRRKDQLHQPCTVTQVDKNQVTEAAALAYPAH